MRSRPPGKMRVLIGCETSGRTREAFRRLGHEARSVDLLPTKVEGDHVVADIFDYLASDDDFDLAILHPTCTKLTVAAAWTLYHPDDKALPKEQRRPHPRFPDRRAEQMEAVDFVRRLWAACDRIPRVAVENPVGVLSTLWRPVSQTFQPYEFGDDASKRTCLWLKGLPLLVKDPALRCPGRLVPHPTVPGRMLERWANQTDAGQNRLTPSADRWAIRSDTYPGVSAAMAEQWGRLAEVLPLASAANDPGPLFEGLRRA